MTKTFKPQAVTITLYQQDVISKERYYITEIALHKVDLPKAKWRTERFIAHRRATLGLVASTLVAEICSSRTGEQVAEVVDDPYQGK